MVVKFLNTLVDLKRFRRADKFKVIFEKDFNAYQKAYGPNLKRGIKVFELKDFEAQPLADGEIQKLIDFAASQK